MNIQHTKTEITAHVVNGFVSDGEGGNPAGVVIDADGLSEDQMLEVAAKVGLSETAFVSSSDEAGFKLDFFTPKRRIAHCGHATIAAFSYLAQTGRVTQGETSKMTVDGLRKIIIKDQQAFMEQLAPTYQSSDVWGASGVVLHDVLRSIGLHTNDLIVGSEPMLVNTGNSFIVIPVKSDTILENVAPDQDAINQISEKLDLVGYYLFSMSPDGDDTVATTRMFAPRYGIPEESATGMAAGPLACYLHDITGIKASQMKIAQGHFMKPASPSLITVDLETAADGKISSLMAGGHGRSMREIGIVLT
ncbi:MAG: PhzF family phenazine biosynthesis protein, partial [Rhizobiaceae bacterium]